MNTMFCLSTCAILLLTTATLSEGRNDSTCEGTEKTRAILDIASESIAKARDLYPTCMDKGNSTSACLDKEKSLTYLEIATNLISEAKKNSPKCDVIQELKQKPKDCSEVMRNGHNVSGVYTIRPRICMTWYKPIDVYCDMDTEGGGWTVIQRRGNFSQQQDFYQDWENYKTGFGNITRDFWLGNENIYAITNQGHYSVRFDLTDKDGSYRFAQYRSFWLEDAKAKYLLHVFNYTGSAVDCMSYHNGSLFSTKDAENNPSKFAQSLKGAWWYSIIQCANLNGIYQPGIQDSKGMFWYSRDNYFSLATSEIKLRVN